MAMSRYTIILLILLPTNVWSDNVISLNKACQPGLHPLEKSQFSLYLSCEGALGNYVGIIMSGNWSQFGNAKWDIGNRFWYEAGWGKDVTSIFFHKEDSTLYIATSSIYGNGGLYKLDLINKKSYLVYPKEVVPEGSEDFYTIKETHANKLILEKGMNGEKYNIEIDLK